MAEAPSNPFSSDETFDASEHVEDGKVGTLPYPHASTPSAGSSTSSLTYSLSTGSKTHPLCCLQQLNLREGGT